MEKLIERSKIGDETSRNLDTNLERKAEMLISLQSIKNSEMAFLGAFATCGTPMKFAVGSSSCTPCTIREALDGL
jgi:hypothetical protein